MQMVERGKAKEAALRWLHLSVSCSLRTVTERWISSTPIQCWRHLVSDMCSLPIKQQNYCITSMALRPVKAGQKWWHVPSVPVLGRQRQFRVKGWSGPQSKFQDSQSYAERHLQKPKTNQTTNQKTVTCFILYLETKFKIICMQLSMCVCSCMLVRHKVDVGL